MGRLTIDGTARAGIKSGEMSAVITRADGSVEDLGVLCRYEPPTFWQRLWGALCRKS